MNELRDEPESTFWPWVIGVALLAVVLWVAGLLIEDEPAAVPLPAPPRTQAVGPGEAFARWVRTAAPAARLQLEARAYAAAALHRLSVALAGEAARHRLEIGARLDSLDAHVTAIAAAPDDAEAAARSAAAMRTALDIARLLPAREEPLERAALVLDAWPPGPTWPDSLDAYLTAMAAAFQ